MLSFVKTITLRFRINPFEFLMPVSLFLSLSWMGQAMAEPQAAAASLPEPLTLEYALSLAAEAHPDLSVAQADLEQAQALRDAVTSDNRVKAAAVGRLRWVEPSRTAPPDEHDDSFAGLAISKRLYDFGRSEARLAAAESEIHSQEALYASVQNRRHLEILEAYFAVLLADLQFARDDEAMAVAYVDFDRQQDRRELGEISDIVFLQSQNLYQAVRSQRYASDVQRRASRARLALLLNRPGQLPSNLVVPELPINTRKLPEEVERLQQVGLSDNPRLIALRASVQARREAVEAARRESAPQVFGQVEAGAYSRALGSSDRFRAGLSLEIPLYTGGAVEAEVARRRADLRRAEAQLLREEMNVRQAVLEAWQSLYVLQARREESRANAEYRDLYLDRSRALYELDVKTDLGDSMVQFSDARLRQAQADYGLALAWARLNALLGKPVLSREEVQAQGAAAESGATVRVP